jgi:hypothetical protein
LTFRAQRPYNRSVARALGPLLLALAAVLAPGADASDARRAVEAYVRRLPGTPVTDLALRQTLTVYHPDGRHPQSTGEQQLYIKPPRRQRLEQTLDGQREIRLTVDDRTWVRQPDGTTVQTPTTGGRDRTSLFAPFRRSAADLLAEWRGLGVREDVSHAVRVRGRPVTIIGAGPSDPASPAVWLDEQYGVIRVITRERLLKGVRLVDLTLSEHRPLLDGLFFPYRQELFADGRMVLLVIVRSVAVNANLPDELFDPEALRRGR